MLKITTESGAVYLDTGHRVMRLSGPFSPGIDYTAVPDAEWQHTKALTGWSYGEPAYINFINGKWRVTTPVVSMEVVED